MLEIWTKEQEAENLSRLFEGVSNKAAFAREFKVPGGASMLSQHCSGHRPMSLEAAIAYAKGFKCSIAQISPRLAVEVHEASNTELSDLKPQNQNIFSPTSSATLADTLAQLGRVIASSDELTRDQLKPLFTRMLDEPQRAPEIIKRIESTISSSGGGAAATDVGHKDMPGFLKR